MRKIIYLSALISFCTIAWGQEQAQNREYIPDIYPVSPSVAELGKYGTYPVNKSTGVPNIEIPLYVIKSGGLELPIKLLYHASGIKVGQEASWVGLGWSLDVGGLISLQTRDTPDEIEGNVYNIPNEDNINQFMGQYYYNHLQMQTMYVNKSWVRDAYTISTPTINGTFFQTSDLGGSIIKLPTDDYSITINTGANNIVNGKYTITDTRGTKYYFKDTEKSTRYMNDADHQVHYTSAWLLNKIVNTSNDSIRIVYGNIFSITPYYTHSFLQTYSIIKDSEAPGQSIESSYSSATTTPVMDNSLMSNLPQSSNKPKEIIFENGRVRFILGNSFGKYSGKYLDKIVIEKKVGNVYIESKRIVFEYSLFAVNNNNVNEQGRLKLERVKEETYEDIKIISEFEYSEASLPTLNSFSQDYFGYYNGKNNMSLLPKRNYISPLTSISDNHYFSLGNADREINLSTIETGILKKIKYPTKGYTLFNYEPNTYFGKEIFPYKDFQMGNLHLDNIGSGYTQPGFGSINFDYSPPEYECASACSLNYCCPGMKSYSYNLTDYLDGQVILNYNALCNGNCDNTNAKYSFAKIRVYNNSALIYSKNIDKSGGVGTEIIDVTQGNITCELELWGHNMSANVEVKLFPGTPIEKTNFCGGLRVKEITNYDSNNVFINKTNFSYNNPNTNNTSGKITNQELGFVWSSDFASFQFSTCESNPTYKEIFSTSFGSNSDTGLTQNSVVYEYVTEENIDNDGNSVGGKTCKFSTDSDVTIDSKQILSLDMGWKRGRLIEEKIFDKDNKIIQETKNFYTIDLNRRTIFDDFKVFQHKSGPDSEPGCMLYPVGYVLLSSYEVVHANYNIPWSYLNNSERREYFYSNNVLNDSISSISYYNYNNPAHQNLSSQTSTSSTGETLTQQFYYPQDLLAQGIMTTEMQTLVNQNRIAEPIKTETLTTVNGTEVQTAETFTKYAQNANTGNLLLPIEIHSLKGTGDINPANTTDRKITYDKYDAQGNVLQYTLENGTPVSVIWGYNGQYPIAKIEGATYNTLGGYAEYLQIKSNEDIDSGINGTTENQLRNVLNSLRTGAISWGTDVQITTYTYNPLIGVTSITDPAGQTAYFIYDSFGRLQSVQDKDGKTLNNYEYHYKNE